MREETQDRIRDELKVLNIVLNKGYLSHTTLTDFKHIFEKYHTIKPGYGNTLATDPNFLELDNDKRTSLHFRCDFVKMFGEVYLAFIVTIIDDSEEIDCRLSYSDYCDRKEIIDTMDKCVRVARPIVKYYNKINAYCKL